MKLSKEHKEKIESEFDFVIHKMIQSKNLSQMIYYFTGIQTLINRIINFEYSDELLFTFFILEKSYKDIVNQIESSNYSNKVTTFHDNFKAKLIEYIKELKQGFFNTNSRIETLKKIVVLTYTCTGNGHYLSEKGIIKIFSEG
ncbi:MAG: hypothetical protein HQK78_18060 [Desulfobacterales bacterium]|nr:hypothetical protein [Desulfobacterales bacterium]